jgi:hypothetical protein
MQEVNTITVHQFDSGLYVELIGLDEYEDIAAVTIEFDYVDSEKTVNPREELPAEYNENITKALAEEGYTVVD